MNYQYNGYDRPTNQYTMSQNVLSFGDVESCGTATAVSVPCMFSNMNRDNYNSVVAKNSDGVLDIVQRAGLNVFWLDNDFGCKGACKNVPTYEYNPKTPEYKDLSLIHI